MSLQGAIQQVVGTRDVSLGDDLVGGENNIILRIKNKIIIG